MFNDALAKLVLLSILPSLIAGYPYLNFDGGFHNLTILKPTSTIAKATDSTLFKSVTLFKSDSSDAAFSLAFSSSSSSVGLSIYGYLAASSDENLSLDWSSASNSYASSSFHSTPFPSDSRFATQSLSAASNTTLSFGSALASTGSISESSSTTFLPLDTASSATNLTTKGKLLTDGVLSITTTNNGVVTQYATYCPLCDNATATSTTVSKSQSTSLAAISSEVVTISTSSSISSIVLTSNGKELTTGVEYITATVDGIVTHYSTFCPFTTTKTSHSVVAGSASTASAAATTSATSSSSAIQKDTSTITTTVFAESTTTITVKGKPVTTGVSHVTVTINGSTRTHYTTLVPLKATHTSVIVAVASSDQSSSVAAASKTSISSSDATSSSANGNENVNFGSNKANLTTTIVIINGKEKTTGVAQVATTDSQGISTYFTNFTPMTITKTLHGSASALPSASTSTVKSSAISTTITTVSGKHQTTGVDDVASTALDGKVTQYNTFVPSTVTRIINGPGSGLNSELSSIVDSDGPNGGAGATVTTVIVTAGTDFVDQSHATQTSKAFAAGSTTTVLTINGQQFATGIMYVATIINGAATLYVAYTPLSTTKSTALAATTVASTANVASTASYTAYTNQRLTTFTTSVATIVPSSPKILTSTATNCTVCEVKTYTTGIYFNTTLLKNATYEVANLMPLASLQTNVFLLIYTTAVVNNSSIATALQFNISGSASSSVTRSQVDAISGYAANYKNNSISSTILFRRDISNGAASLKSWTASVATILTKVVVLSAVGIFTTAVIIGFV